ncbi:Gfo/Idh/MocA family oxidoreductase [Bradyrhizobium sp. ORS 375]|uniref:Gfo/Idh/MocA family protein n=1 Tax=Bradyrhizobium sp. (strain ORS 375) TaxID=566679 RepID=UPI0002D84EF3|nr:Gfo/Idh/MocA family oxidoreductase [Bradyrhizobium sp. ORS 375]
MSNVQIAMIGCGAIADQYYFPALAADKALRAATWIVDPSPESRSRAIRKFGFAEAQQLSSSADLPDSISLAINATPSHLHVTTTMPLIARGINVIVEKPFAEFSDQALSMVDAATGKCLLSVNQYRRLAPSYAKVRALIENDEIGEIRRISWSEGHKFDWPTQSGFYFRRPWGTGRPRGALLDIGVHVLDQICWWIEDTPTPLSVVMDGYGGPEAFVLAKMASGNIEIDLGISFHGKLANSFVIEGSKGTIKGSTHDYARMELKTGKGGWRSIPAVGATGWPAMATRLVTNVTETIAGRDKLLVAAADVIPSLVAIDSLYAAATELWPDSYKEWMA